MIGGRAAFSGQETFEEGVEHASSLASPDIVSSEIISHEQKPSRSNRRRQMTELTRRRALKVSAAAGMAAA
ncbi:hypothetical protein ACFQ07_08530, partial [Actinomadura adrarensis]